MATYTFPDDQRRLRKIFDLPREQLYSSSLLYSLMRDQEIFDSQESEDTVGDTLTLMTTAESLITSYESQNRNIASVASPGEWSVSYSSGGPAAQTASRLEEVKQQIKQLLDPDNYLNAHYAVSRVVPN